MGILNLPCARTVQGYLRNNRSSPGISEQTLLQNHEQYEQYKLERKKSGYAVPKGVGILIWDETKVQSGLIWNSANSSVTGYAMASEELSNLHDVYEQLDSEEMTQKTTYVLQFLWRDLTSDFDVLGPYFTLSGSIETRFLYSIVTRTMLAFRQFNFHVHALLCDGASSNLSLLKLLSGTDELDEINGKCPWFISPYDGENFFLIICLSHQLKNMIAALYSSRIGGTKQFYKNGVYIGWETIEDLDLQRAKDGLSRRVPQLKYSHVVRDSWTRLNVLPAKIMQQQYMIRAIYDISEQIVKKKKKVTAKYLDACNLLFERGILSHSTITSNDSQVLKNMQRGLNYFMDWHEEMTENDHNCRNPNQKTFLAWQTYDLLTIMHYGFVGLCSYMQAKYPGYLIAPLRINGSAVESVFSSLKFIAGGHLASTNYSSTLATLITQRQTCINPNSEKGYRK